MLEGSVYSIVRAAVDHVTTSKDVNGDNVSKAPPLSVVMLQGQRTATRYRLQCCRRYQGIIDNVDIEAD